MRPEEYEGEMIDPRGGFSTTESFHRHYCEECGGVWGHADETCPGPRWTGRMVMGGMWKCPLCEEQ